MTIVDIIFILEMAEMLGVSKATLHRKSWRQKTGCPIIKRGKKLFAIRNEFEKWLKGTNG